MYVVTCVVTCCNVYIFSYNFVFMMMAGLWPKYFRVNITHNNNNNVLRIYVYIYIYIYICVYMYTNLLSPVQACSRYGRGERFILDSGEET